MTGKALASKRRGGIAAASKPGMRDAIDRHAKARGATELRPNRGVAHKNSQRGPERDKKFRDFVRNRPCVLCCLINECKHCKDFLYDYNFTLNADGSRRACDQKSATEAAHMGSHGISQKASDRTCIPLCGLEHHREGKHSAHKLGRKFAAHHSLDIAAIQTRLLARYYGESANA